jgi:hypothetical protein
MALSSLGDDRNVLDQRFIGTIILMSRYRPHPPCILIFGILVCASRPLGLLYHEQRFQWFVVFPQIREYSLYIGAQNQLDGIRIDIMNAIKNQAHRTFKTSDTNQYAANGSLEATSANPFPPSFGCYERLRVLDSSN